MMAGQEHGVRCTGVAAAVIRGWVSVQRSWVTIARLLRNGDAGDSDAWHLANSHLE
jgi:hypothetical protein